MKKLILALSLLISTNSYAGIVSVDPFISGNDVTINHLETLRKELSDEINGNLEGGINIKPQSIISDDLATSINPVTRWNEAFNDFTISGMLPATDSDLDSDISAGVSYVNGVRIDKAAEAHTYTASKDTYVYIGPDGYQYVEVANGAAAPTTPTNTLLLAKVVTDADNITSVADQRTLSIQITATVSNFPTHYRDRATVVRDSATAFKFVPGELAIGTTIYSRTSNTSSKDITTDTNWIEGTNPSGDDTHCFLYAFNDSGSSWDFKYSSADPAFADVDENTVGKLRYYKSGGVTYRALAWIWKSGDSVNSWEYSNFPDHGVKNYVVDVFGTDEVITATQTTYQKIDGGNINFYTTGGMVEQRMEILTQAAAGNIFQAKPNWGGSNKDNSVSGVRTHGTTEDTDEASATLLHAETTTQGSLNIHGLGKLSSAANYTIDSVRTVVEEK